MTVIGFNLNFINRNTDKLNIMTAIRFVSDKIIAPSRQKALIIMVTPAVAIIATTAGRNAVKILCKIFNFLYFV